MNNPDFYRYLEEIDAHYIDYKGRVNMKEGLRRIKFIEKIFIDSQRNGRPLRFLMDARGYIKESPETHDKLAKMSREKFDKEFNNVTKFMAVLNDASDFEISKFEVWFTDEKEAKYWLSSRKA